MADVQRVQLSASPWLRRPLAMPPDSTRAWIRLAVWEFWMGAIVCVAILMGVQQIVTAPSHVVTLHDLSGCYVPSPATPCERITRTGALNVVFGALFGVTLLVVAMWLLWELWTAVEPKPITDDFLKLLDDSFGRDWRNPLTWPWARLSLAYGFTLVGVASTAGAAVLIAILISRPEPAKRPSVDTSQSFRLSESRTPAAALATVAIVASLAPLRAVPWAQKSDTRATFDVVSIKENKSGPATAGGDRFGTVFSPAGRFTARNATLQNLVLTAYRDEFPAGRISGFADWMMEKRFDVDARVDAGVPPAGEPTRVGARQLQVMLRSMLEDRFALRTRREERSEEVQVLSVVPSGHKMKPATDASACGSALDKGRAVASQCHILQVDVRGLDGTAVDTGDIAGALQFFLKRPVIDRAKLPGLYRVSARWTDDPSVYTALREQLGLRLDAERTPLPTLIVESAALPRAN